MFTGIVTDVGEVAAVEPRAAGLVRLKIACGYDPDAIAIGDSVRVVFEAVKDPSSGEDLMIPQWEVVRE